MHIRTWKFCGITFFAFWLQKSGLNANMRFRNFSSSQYFAAPVECGKVIVNTLRSQHAECRSKPRKGHFPTVNTWPSRRTYVLFWVCYSIHHLTFAKHSHTSTLHTHVILAPSHVHTTWHHSVTMDVTLFSFFDFFSSSQMLNLCAVTRWSAFASSLRQRWKNQ